MNDNTSTDVLCFYCSSPASWIDCDKITKQPLSNGRRYCSQHAMTHTNGQTITAFMPTTSPGRIENQIFGQ